MDWWNLLAEGTFLQLTLLVLSARINSVKMNAFSWLNFGRYNNSNSKKQGAPHVSQMDLIGMVDELQTLFQHAVLYRPEWKNVHQV